jgi:hypothetical protein
MNPQQEWTVMYFFAADGNNAPTMISQLKAITNAGFQANTTVLVHFDPNTNDRPPRVFDVNSQRKGIYGKAGRPTVIGDGRDFFVRTIRKACTELPQKTGKSAAGTLARFLEFARITFPARNYILFLVGHGMIVANDSFLPDTDEDSTSAITLKELGSVLRKFGNRVKTDKSNFQLVGFHSCSMSSIEVAYELKDSARYMIGTQGLAFPDSWPYRQILKMIFLAIDRRGKRKPKLRPDYDKVTQRILRYIQTLNFYNADDFFLAGYSADISMCSLDSHRIAPLTEAMQALSRSLQAALKNNAAKEVILLAHWKSQSYFQENYTDLYDFCKCLAGRCDPASRKQLALRLAAVAVMNVLETSHTRPFDRLIPFSDFFGPEYQYSHGLSIYFPWAAPSARVLKRYQAYAFEQTLKLMRTNGHKKPVSGSWLSFLNAYFRLTQRGARDSKQEKKTSFIGPNGQRAHAVLKLNTKQALSFGNGGSNGGSSLAIGDGKPTPSLSIGEGKPAPSLGGGDGKPTPSMGVSGFGFTVTKNFPALPAAVSELKRAEGRASDTVLSSRPSEPYPVRRRPRS